MPFHSRPRLAHLLAIIVMVPISSFLLLRSALPTPAKGQTDETSIAYISSSTTGQSIRMIQPDGSGDQLVWQAPERLHFDLMIHTLDWHPSNTEILFASGHDWQRSTAERDLLAVAPDGSQLRRLNRPPGPEASKNLPLGTVTFLLEAYEEGDVSLYIDGADNPLEYFARTGFSYHITATVRDLGDGVRQYMRLYDPDSLSLPCHLSEEGWVDVIPGQTTDLGTIRFGIAGDHTCPAFFSPRWTHDGQSVLFLQKEPSTTGSTDNNVWVTGKKPQPGTIGTRIINMNDYVLRDRLSKVEPGPPGDSENQFLMLEDDIENRILISNFDNPGAQVGIDTDTCPSLLSCEFLDIHWLPDGSGFIYSQFIDSVTRPKVGRIYQYDLASETATELFQLEEEIIGKLSLSPDGSQIAFERGNTLDDTRTTFFFGPRLLCPCSIWTVNADGTGLTELVADGRAPAWSSGEPTVVPPGAVDPSLDQKSWLPFLRK